MKKISIVVPMYNEKEMAPLFFEAVNKAVEPIKNDYEIEIVAVNDGSKDNTLDILKDIQKNQDNLVIVNLSRNFGHERAVHAGLLTASGDAVIPIDADLQDPPEIIPELVAMWEDGYKVVNAQRSSRKKDSFFKRNTAGLYYRYISKISPKVHIPQNVANYRLLDRRVVDEINALHENNRVLRVQVPFVGFKTGTVQFVRQKREKGESKYNFSAMFSLALDSVTALTSKPLHISIGMLIGSIVLFLVSGISELVLYILYANHIFEGLQPIHYLAWLVCNVGLIFMIVILGVLAIISVYLSVGVEESKHRPNVIIDEVIKK